MKKGDVAKKKSLLVNTFRLGKLHIVKPFFFRGIKPPIRRYFVNWINKNSPAFPMGMLKNGQMLLASWMEKNYANDVDVSSYVVL